MKTNKRFIYTSYGAIMDTSKTTEEGQMVFDADLDGIGEMCNLLNKQNEETERWKAHKDWDDKIVQEQADLIVKLKKSLNYACEAVFDETLPYKEIQEMKQKYGKYTVGIILEDVLFYYEKLAEEEMKNE